MYRTNDYAERRDENTTLLNPEDMPPTPEAAYISDSMIS